MKRLVLLLALAVGLGAAGCVNEYIDCEGDLIDAQSAAQVLEEENQKLRMEIAEQDGEIDAMSAEIATLEVVLHADTNRNGKLTCAEVKAAGIDTPVEAGHPAYSLMRDRDGDGRVCQ